MPRRSSWLRRRLSWISLGVSGGADSFPGSFKLNSEEQVSGLIGQDLPGTLKMATKSTLNVAKEALTNSVLQLQEK